MFVDVRELPRCVKEILKRIGFNKREISFERAQKISLRCPITLPYNRGFCILLNLTSGKYKIGLGSFGGTNQFTKTIVDDCGYHFNIPENFIIIKGEHGQSGTWATLTMRPEEALPFVGLEEDCHDRMYKILKVLHKTAGKRRDELIKGFRPADISDGVKLSYIAVRGRTSDYLKITKRGKKFIRQYEELFPNKEVL